MEQQKVALVSGGSSGIGAATAQALQAAGCRVYSLSRRPYQAPGITHLIADVCDESQVQAALEQIAQEAGRLDILINNAGFGISGAAEFTPQTEARQQMEVNVLGVANCCRLALPYLRQSRGRIVNISSVAAILPIPYQAWYSASKAAVNAYTLALANEVRAFGISVCAVQPGDIHTGFTAARRKCQEGDALYGGAISRAVSRMEQDEESGLEPAWLAQRIVRVALKKQVKPFYTPGFNYGLFAVLAAVLPRKLSNFIVGKMYG